VVAFSVIVDGGSGSDNYPTERRGAVMESCAMTWGSAFAALRAAERSRQLSPFISMIAA
jgi:hypothetical protein